MSAKARAKRSEIFRRNFLIQPTTKILDLGSEDGSNIYQVLKGTDHLPQNVYIADINEKSIDSGKEKYGYQGVLIDEEKPLPFPDNYFDIVYCSSVIEHVTLPKKELWDVTDGGQFARKAFIRQQAFAKEIIRLGQQYFVQTPCRSFPIESHTWLPLAGYLPRRALLKVMKVSNRFWIKAAEPDFNLLNEKELAALFPGAMILRERKFGLTKSLMAIYSKNISAL